MSRIMTPGSSPFFEEPHPVSRLSYRCIVAGTLAFFGIQALLMTLGWAFGVGPGRADAARAAWLIGELIVSAFVGGLVASLASQTVRGGVGVLNGFVVWC